MAGFQLQIGFEIARLGDVGDHVYDAAGGVATIERALRSAQHLYPLDIEILLLEQAIADQRRVVEADRDGRVGRDGQRLGANAADREIIADRKSTSLNSSQ